MTGFKKQLFEESKTFVQLECDINSINLVMKKIFLKNPFDKRKLQIMYQQYKGIISIKVITEAKLSIRYFFSVSTYL